MGASSARATQKKAAAGSSSTSSWRVYFVLIVVCLFGGMAARSLFWSQAEPQATSAQVPATPGSGSKLPAFSLMPLSQSLLGGQAYTNKNLEGHKTVFLIVKASCPHCKKECAWLSSYMPNLKSRASVVVASISTAPETSQFVAETGMNEGMYVNGSNLAMALGVRAVPVMFLLDEAGTIRYFHQGELEPEKLKFVLETFLQGGDPSAIAQNDGDVSAGRGL